MVSASATSASAAARSTPGRVMTSSTARPKPLSARGPMPTVAVTVVSAGTRGSALSWEAANFILSFVVITVLFALLFRVLPDTRIAWRDVWIGSALTALLFVIGKYLIGLYLGQAAVASSYGAAGSLIILLLWTYYSSQILFFGAEFTRAFAKRYGTHRDGAQEGAPVAGK